MQKVTLFRCKADIYPVKIGRQNAVGRLVQLAILNHSLQNNS